MRPDTPPARNKPILVAACLLALAGCQGDRSPGVTGEHEEEHAGHVIPAHKPRTFPEAVRRLREFNDRLGREGVGATRPPSPDPPPLRVALDIANWLPEIAADSDMPEKPWDEINARSAALVKDYRALLSGGAGDAGRVVRGASEEIGHIERLLDACDPRWFQGAGTNEAAP